MLLIIETVNKTFVLIIVLYHLHKRKLNWFLMFLAMDHTVLNCKVKSILELLTYIFLKTNKEDLHNYVLGTTQSLEQLFNFPENSNCLLKFKLELDLIMRENVYALAFKKVNEVGN